jgi:GDP-4-dehydro-6-deoxy-D-mannose reductase
VRIADLAESLLGLAAHPMRLVVDPTRYRPVDVPVLRGSNDRLRATTGWAPEIPLETSLGDILDECRAVAAAAVS